MIRSVSAKTVRPTSRSSKLAALRAIPHLAVFRPGDRSRPRNAGKPSSTHPARIADRPFASARTPAAAEAVHRKPQRKRRVCFTGSGGRSPQADPDGNRFGTPACRGGRVRSSRATACPPRWSRCRAAFCSSRQDPAYRRAVLGETPARIAVRRASRLRGTAIWGSKAASSECTDSALRERLAERLPEVRHHH